MTLLLKQFIAFIKLLNSETGTNQISAGLALGVILGFAPALSLQTLIVLFLVFIFRIQLGAAFLSAFFFKFIAYLFDHPSHLIGNAILQNAQLRPLFTTLYNMPLAPLTRFNNTIVMGSMAISFLLSPFLFFIFRRLVIKYRENVVANFRNSKFWKALSATKFYELYQKYNSLYGP